MKALQELHFESILKALQKRYKKVTFYMLLKEHVDFLTTL